MENLLTAKTYDLINEYLSVNDNDDPLESALYKEMIRIDIKTLSGLKIKIDAPKFREYISEQLEKLGYINAAKDVRTVPRNKVKTYALWAAKKFYVKYGIDLVTAKNSDDEELKQAWVHYCRLLLIFIHFNPTN